MRLRSPGSAPGGGSEPISVPCPRGATGRATVSYTGGCSFESSRGRCRLDRGDADRCVGGLTEREGARLLSDGRGQTSPAFDPLPLRPGRYASLAGAPCFENRYTALPWGFDTSTFRSSSRPVRPAVGRLPLTQRTQVRVLHGSPSAGDAHPGPSCGRKACGGQQKRKAGMHSPRGMT